ncbi:hypothetical protein Tco_1107702 [Tanacetum coccineum]
MAELVRLLICEELVDTWAWVAPRPERQPDAAAGAPEVAEGAPDVDEGAQAVPAPEEVHGLGGSMTEQKDVLDNMAHDFSRFTSWTVSSLSLMMDRVGVRIPKIGFCMFNMCIAQDLAEKKSTNVGEVSII